MPQRVVLAPEEPPKLLGTVHVEPDLDEGDAVLDQHLLERTDLCKEALALFGGAEAEHMLDHGAVVPGAVEEGDFSAARQLADVALEIPFAALALARFRQCDDTGDARVEMGADAADGTALAGRVAPLEQHHQPRAALDHMTLKLDKLDLERRERLFIGLAGQARRVGVAGKDRSAIVPG